MGKLRYGDDGTPQKISEDSNNDAPKTQQPVKVKVGVYPARLQHLVISNLTTLLDANFIDESELDVSPVDQTHELSIIQIDRMTANNTDNEKQGGMFLVGIAEEAHFPPVIDPLVTSNDICRAYHKLSEAFERYRHYQSSNAGPRDNSVFSLSKVTSGSKRKNDCSSSKPIIAVDCGSSPGGWTKYLTEQTIYDEVFSIDPGEMDESVTALANVHHLRMKALDALPKIHDILAKRDDNPKVSLWVSDMCVKDVPKQVDTFLRAKEEGIFEPNLAFVLTIKCYIGHGKRRFDMLAEEQAKRLEEAGAYDMHVVHLFSNRIGERTIVGYIK